MRTKPQSSQRKMSWAGTLITLAVIILFSCSQRVLAQQWSTNGNNISNTNTGNVGVGTTSPGSKLDVNGRIQQTGSATDAGYLLTNSGLLANATALNPGIAFYGGNGVNALYGADLGFNSSTGRYRTRVFSGVHLADVALGRQTNAQTNPTQSAFVEFLTVRGDTGSVGIGTAAPNYNLEVSSGPHPYFPAVNIITSTDPTSERATIGFGLNATVTQGWVFGQDFNANGTRDMYLYDVSNSRTLMYWGANNNVGIGTITPGAKLEVVGNVNVTGTGNITAAGTIEGGNIKAKYQDVAEWVESSQELPAGTVVVVDHTKSNQVIASSQPYDTRVAGVISSQPGIALGEAGHNKVLVATTGRVRIKVDTSHGPIQVGDLLVTSDIPGVAMKSQGLNIGGVQLHRPGTLIGKALEPLAKGCGEILVLLSLQ